MSSIVVLSFDSEASPGLTLHKPRVRKGGGFGQYGWGFGWYPGDEVTAVVLKNPDSSEKDAVSGVLREWERFRSSTFVCHLRGSSKKALQRDAQPFLKSYAGRHWILAHNGDLREDYVDKLPLGVHPVFEPIGKSDSEHMFCWLLTALRSEGARSMEDYGWSNLTKLLAQINDLGTANMVLTDGRHVVVHNDRNNFDPLKWIRRVPPHPSGRLDFEDLDVDLEGPFDRNRTMVIVASEPQSEEPWVPMAPGQTLVLRGGIVVWASEAPALPVDLSPAAGSTGALGASVQQADHQQAAAVASPSQLVRATTVSSGGSFGAGVASTSERQASGVVEQPRERILSVVHSTVYSYSQPIEHSGHVLRLRPTHDELQHVLEHSLVRSVDGPYKDFEDVFGNQSTYVELSAAYSELTINAHSTVRVHEPESPASRSSSRRDVLPLVWMPWQRQMMLPYLLPPELPESELQELTEFAMSFVARNDNDLYETVSDINRTIYRDFAYETGSTTLETTPYEVFVSRRGVCQDFANLMICLARLLNVPARYRVGYIYTGGNYENKVQSEASHAWVELYLPWNGWRGFDPTNGCMAGVDHVRIACGRNYRDATPTTGTIYKGQGGVETLSVEVRVEDVSMTYAAGTQLP